MTKQYIILLLLMATGIGANAQHEHHMPMQKDTTKKVMPKMNMAKKDTVKEDHPMQHGHDMKMDMPPMSHAFSLNLPVNTNGSGTGWLPEASPMYGYMAHSKKWMYMLHGNIYGRYNHQDLGNKGSRGAAKWDAPNWLMFMGQRKVGKRGLFHFSSMLSLDAPIAGKTGYPLLFQTGETANGKPLVDRQHPHDLFSELSVSYVHALSKKSDVFIYLGYPGEPALGSVAFMHRPSALANPDAPLSHHWNDGTHITFGVATIGARLGKFKLEASSFTGREPGEDRYNFDKPRFDSWSGRFSFAPTKNWALQVSHGFIKSLEVLHTHDDVYRTTASAIYSRALANGWLNGTALWGLNKVKGHEGENAALLEASWNIKRLTLSGRYEWVQKSAEELDLDELVYGNRSFPVNAFSLGFNYGLLKFKNTWLSAGSQFSFFTTSSRLDHLYGNNPVSAQVFIRLSPALMKMKM